MWDLLVIYYLHLAQQKDNPLGLRCKIKDSAKSLLLQEVTQMVKRQNKDSAQKPVNQGENDWSFLSFHPNSNWSWKSSIPAGDNPRRAVLSGNRRLNIPSAMA